MTAFGTQFCDQFATAEFTGGQWGAGALKPLAPLSMHPAAHVFHYASTCFEGFKAYRWADDSIHIFRLKDHVARMQKSAASLHLPIPDTELLTGMVIDVVAANRDAGALRQSGRDANAKRKDADAGGD